MSSATLAKIAAQLGVTTTQLEAAALAKELDLSTDAVQAAFAANRPAKPAA